MFIELDKICLTLKNEYLSENVLEIQDLSVVLIAVGRQRRGDVSFTCLGFDQVTVSGPKGEYV
jgi:hypothetical protein